MSDSTQPIPMAVADRRESRRPVSTGIWRAIGWWACGVAGLVLIAWFIALAPGELGSKAQWFFGAGVYCVVMVVMWQTFAIQRQANQAAAEAAERMRTELAAAGERAARELALTRELHRTEMEAQQKVHHAEMEAQRELARVERTQLLKQLQKQAMLEVSRAVSAHSHMLATLWNQSATILRIEERDAREQAMHPVFEQISHVVNDFSVELTNARLFIDDDRVDHALARVNEAVLMAIEAAQDVHAAVVDGREPDPNRIPDVQRNMYKTAAEARRLAWDLLRTGFDDGASPTG